MSNQKKGNLIFKDKRKESKQKEESMIHQEFIQPEVRQEVKNIMNSMSDAVDVEKAMNIDKFRMSFIEDYEEEEARRQIRNHLGFEPPRVVGWHMAVKIFVRPEDVHEFKDEKGETKKLYLPSMATANDKFRNCSALVLSQGPDCYTGERFNEHWFRALLRIFFNRWMSPRTKFPWCKVGDWIVIARNAGPQINYRGIPVTIIPDDQAYCVIQDPSHVTRD